MINVYICIRSLLVSELLDVQSEKRRLLMYEAESKYYEKRDLTR